MEITVRTFLLLITVSSLASCLRDEPVNIVETETETKEEEKTDQATLEYVLGAPADYSTKLEGLSAICLNEAGDGLYVAEDNGRVYEFGLEGKLKDTFSVPSPNDAHDWEGITRAKDGKIYLCEERLREVYLLSADHKSVSKVSSGPYEDGGQENQGYEGIAAGDGVLYVANQSLPLRVYKYSLADKTWETAFDADWATSLSDIYFDSDDGTLWITDAKTQKLTQMTTGGEVIKDYDISFVKKPEGFCKDAARKQFWFVCDKTSKLQTVSYQ